MVKEQIQQFLDGRIWLRNQMPFPESVLQQLIKDRSIQVMDGIVATNNWFGKPTYFCQRCENKQQQLFTSFHCAKCEKVCVYCRNCLKMGRVASCTELLQWTGESVPFQTAHVLAWEGKPTIDQQRASDEIIQSLTLKKPHLLYAVCGSGKTEMLFQPIYYLLSEGIRVCVAAPRVDVILELEPRFRAAFPNTKIDALYGGATPSKQACQLILATTHQLYRFRHAFDAVFVDEADAFPYTTDDTLQQAVKKAAKQNAPIHYVTATPADDLLAKMKKTGSVSIINTRYHRHPMPLPRFEPLWNYNKRFQQLKIPSKLQQWVQLRLQLQQPFLLFFHHIETMERILPLFQQLHPAIQAVHAEHTKRKEYVQQLRNKQLPGLLTTTILERGITIPNVQVAIIGAEQRIFSKGAIIQIGGRVGRSSDYPTGDFVLFHHGITYAMDEAKRELIRLNKGAPT